MTDFETAGRLAVLLVRPGALVLSAPLFGTPFAPAPVRLGLIVLLGAAMAASAPVPASALSGGLALVVAREMAIGLALGMAIRVMVAAAEAAGAVSGYQVGLSYGAMVDPQSGVRNGSLSLLYANVTLVLCFVLGVHHELVRALQASLIAMPIGVGGLDPQPQAIAGMLGFVITGGLRLAAPLIAVMLLVEVMMGLMARAAPQLNLLVVGAPVRLPVGLLVVAATVSAMPALVSRWVPEAFELAATAARAFR